MCVVLWAMLPEIKAMMMMMMLQIDSYSVFYDNAHLMQTGLHDSLTARNIATLYIVGLATDYCVYYSAMDASTLGLVAVLTFCRLQSVSEKTASVIF